MPTACEKKSSEKKTTEKSVEKKTTDKSVEKKTTEKSVEKKTTDKSVEKKTTEKIVVKKTADKSEEKKIIEKSVEKKSTEKTGIELIEPLKQIQTVIDRKTRNLEKRKNKLETYKEKLKDGLELKEEQLKAIDRFDELADLIEFFKGLTKTISTVNNEHVKSSKKQLKIDVDLRHQQEITRLKTAFYYLDVLNKFNNPKIRTDFITGSNGAIQISEEKFKCLDDIRKIEEKDASTVDLRDQKDIDACSQRLFDLVEGRNKHAETGIKYKEMRELVNKITKSGYFKTCDEVTEEQTTIKNECDNLPVTQNETITEQPVEINDRLVEAVSESQPIPTSVYNVIQTTYDNQDPAVISITPYPQPYMTNETMPHGMTLQGSTQPQKVNFEEVNTHQPIQTQTFTNQNYSFQPVSISQPSSISVGGIPISAIPVQNVSPHQIPTSSPTQILSEQAQQNQQITQNQPVNSFSEWTPIDTNVENNTFGGDENSFAHNQHGQYHKKEGYRGRGGMRGNYRGQSNGYNGRGRGGHKGFQNNNYGNNVSNGSYYTENKRGNYSNRSGTYRGSGRGGQSGSFNRNQNPNYGGYQGKQYQPQHHQQQEQQ